MAGKRRERTGVVLSNRMQKTVLVMVERTVRHSKYKKRLKVRTKYKAHDEQDRCRIGDQVAIVETRPLSRDKRWAVRTILKKAPVLGEAPQDEAVAKQS